MKVLKVEVETPNNDNQYIATVLASKEEVAALFGGVPATSKPVVAETKTAPATTAAAGSNGVAKASPAAATKPAEKPAEKPKAAAEKPKAAAEKPKAETKPAEKPALDLVGDDEDEPAVGDQPAEDDDEPAFSLDGDPPEELMTAGRLLTVVSFLHGRGFHTVEAITAACNKLKDKVPLLKANANFAERIPVAFAALPQA
jgi:hypothetical protein